MPKIGCITGTPGPVLLIVPALPAIVEKEKESATQKDGSTADGYADDGSD